MFCLFLFLSSGCQVEAIHRVNVRLWTLLWLPYGSQVSKEKQVDPYAKRKLKNLWRWCKSLMHALNLHPLSVTQPPPFTLHVEAWYLLLFASTWWGPRVACYPAPSDVWNMARARNYDVLLHFFFFCSKVWPFFPSPDINRCSARKHAWSISPSGSPWTFRHCCILTTSLLTVAMFFFFVFPSAFSCTTTLFLPFVAFPLPPCTLPLWDSSSPTVILWSVLEFMAAFTKKKCDAASLEKPSDSSLGEAAPWYPPLYISVVWLWHY